MKNIGVLFTGGLDSTYLVYKNLKEGNNVFPFYIELKNNEYKTKQEKQNIEELIKLFEKEFKDKINPLTIMMEVLLHVNHVFPLSQLPIWLLGICYNQNNYYRKIDEFQIGYICGDDAISYLDNFYEIYNAYNKFALKELIPIKFPLIKDSKYNLITELPKEYAEKIFSCESDNFRHSEEIEFIPCGKCHTCLNYERLAYDCSNILNKFPRLINKNKFYALQDFKFSDKYINANAETINISSESKLNWKAVDPNTDENCIKLSYE